MTPPRDLPPLTPAEAGVVLQRLGDLTSTIVLVGGQALAFWVEHYVDRFDPPGPINSKDIDFCGSQAAVATAAARLGGTYEVPEPFAHTPSTGIVSFVDPSGHDRWIDFLGDPYGLSSVDVAKWSVEVEVPLPGVSVTFRVMHPVHCMRSRISNVGGLPGYQTAHALDQARASVSCAREFIRDVLEHEGAKAAGRLNEHVYRFAWGNLHARNVFRDYGIDPFEAVLVDPRMPPAFMALRYPDMQRRLARRRRQH
ncbi:MAG: hypothetical protein JNK64_24115 [Myxococcales bacterium]|nr:hypothetical protein [Myxococcales bacterium]